MTYPPTRRADRLVVLVVGRDGDLRGLDDLLAGERRRVPGHLEGLHVPSATTLARDLDTVRRLDGMLLRTHYIISYRPTALPTENLLES